MSPQILKYQLTGNYFVSITFIMMYYREMIHQTLPGLGKNGYMTSKLHQFVKQFKKPRNLKCLIKLFLNGKLCILKCHITNNKCMMVLAKN